MSTSLEQLRHQLHLADKAVIEQMNILNEMVDDFGVKVEAHYVVTTTKAVESPLYEDGTSGFRITSMEGLDTR